ncbi:protein of unknown function [Streptantibioticus cattleyicolor NRRL 8057 = DSM 46488]|nr:protein of unknown function [Streptantibioticus cattleyicolor NRRL 8057 = DSM 46488]
MEDSEERTSNDRFWSPSAMFWWRIGDQASPVDPVLTSAAGFSGVPYERSVDALQSPQLDRIVPVYGQWRGNGGRMRM